MESLAPPVSRERALSEELRREAEALPDVDVLREDDVTLSVLVERIAGYAPAHTRLPRARLLEGSRGSFRPALEAAGSGASPAGASPEPDAASQLGELDSVRDCPSPLPAWWRTRRCSRGQRRRCVR
jgi:hypothetical protein